MRVLIELFDKDPIENLIASCVFEPDMVVFLCDSTDANFFKESAVYRLLRRRKLKTMPRFYYMDSTNIKEIQNVINAVVRDYPGCVFNFSGGRDLILIMAGAHSQKYGIPSFYIDLRNKKLIDVVRCGHLVDKFKIPSLSAEDYLAMSGATIQGHGHFTPTKIDDEFEEDILNVWEIVRFNPKAWSEFVSFLQSSCAKTSSNVLKIDGVKNKWHNNNAILRHLKKCGIMDNTFKKNSKTGSITFKSPLHKKCLLNQGIWLELFCYVQAKQTGFFDDVRTSVVVDWDGVEGGADSTKNEIDVLLVKGVVPIFISCKMGLPSPLALSEIRLLSTKFGGVLTRTVLLTAGNLNGENKALQTRARDLHIHLIDRAYTYDNDLGEELMRITQDNSYCTV